MLRALRCMAIIPSIGSRSEEHTSELQSQSNLVCRLLLEKKKYHVVPEGVRAAVLPDHVQLPRVGIDRDAGDHAPGPPPRGLVSLGYRATGVGIIFRPRGT